MAVMIAGLAGFWFNNIRDRSWIAERHLGETTFLVADHVVLALREKGVQDDSKGGNIVLDLGLIRPAVAHTILRPRQRERHRDAKLVPVARGF